jgi:hypothetical protein
LWLASSTSPSTRSPCAESESVIGADLGWRSRACLPALPTRAVTGQKSVANL